MTAGYAKHPTLSPIPSDDINASDKRGPAGPRTTPYIAGTMGGRPRTVQIGGIHPSFDTVGGPGTRRPCRIPPGGILRLIDGDARDNPGGFCPAFLADPAEALRRILASDPLDSELHPPGNFSVIRPVILVIPVIRDSGNYQITKKLPTLGNFFLHIPFKYPLYTVLKNYQITSYSVKVRARA